MYKIHFNPEIGKFVIQVLHLSLFWKTVLGENGPLDFMSFDEARKHVSKIGLDQLYQDRSENTRRTYMLSH
jgi:hypothetical protein